MRRTSVKRSLLIWCSVGLGTGFPKSAPCGTPSGPGPQSQIVVAQLSHEASLHKRSAEPLWRLSPAIHGLRNFWKACPQPHKFDFLLFAGEFCVLRFAFRFCPCESVAKKLIFPCLPWQKNSLPLVSFRGFSGKKITAAAYHAPEPQSPAPAVACNAPEPGLKRPVRYGPPAPGGGTDQRRPVRSRTAR